MAITEISLGDLVTPSVTIAPQTRETLMEDFAVPYLGPSISDGRTMQEIYDGAITTGISTGRWISDRIEFDVSKTYKLKDDVQLKVRKTNDVYDYHIGSIFLFSSEKEYSFSEIMNETFKIKKVVLGTQDLIVDFKEEQITLSSNLLVEVNYDESPDIKLK